MTLKYFYLLGDDPSTAIDIEVDVHHSFKALQEQIAADFVIVEPSGIAFQSSQNKALEEVDDVAECEGPIAITIDGHPVRDAPGPKGLPLAGSYFEVFPDHLGNHQRMFEQFGPVIKTTDMGRTTYLTNDSTIAQIAFSEGPFFTKNINENHPLYGIKNDRAGIFTADTDSPNWDVAHKFIPPAFTPKAIRHYIPLMQKTIEEAFPVFDELDQGNEEFNVYQYMLKLGSQAIGKFVLHMDLHHFDSVDAPLHRLVAAMAETLSLNKKVSAKGDWYSHLPFGDPKRLKVVKYEVLEMLKDARDKCPKGGDDNLPLTSAALNASCIVDYINRAVDAQGNKFPQENMLDVLIIVVGAGFVTTSSLLSWLLYCCVTYPDMQERLLQEIIDHDIDSNTQIDADMIGSLTFLDKFVKETQRLHNPSYQPGRTARIDCILPGGYRMPKDAVMIVSLPHILNNPSLWDNPAKFDTERWDTERVKNRDKCTYVPFAYGKRQCIGFNFALTEVKVFLIQLVYRYKFDKKDDNPIQYDPMFQLIRPLDLYVRAMKRTELPKKGQSPTNGTSR